MREIVLDTETTGIGPDHRIVEIGCVEIDNLIPTGRTFHEYVNPERKVDPGAFRVHGISDAFLSDKPVFKRIAARFLDFIGNAPLVAQNATFDQTMLDREFQQLGLGKILNPWTDTLPLARQVKKGGKHNLDVLCKHFGIGNQGRKLHGALLDAQLLAEVYLHLRGGRQFGFGLQDQAGAGASVEIERLHLPLGTFAPRITPAECEAHAAFIAQMENPIWQPWLDEPDALPLAA